MPGTRPNNVKETALGKWLRAATTEEQEELTRMLGLRSTNYLRVLAGVHRENPRLRLALSIVHGIATINNRAKFDKIPRHLPCVTLADLASPTRRDPSDDAIAIETFSKD